MLILRHTRGKAFLFPSVIVHRETILGRGHNRRVQLSAILHGEMDALENAHRQPASV